MSYCTFLKYSGKQDTNKTLYKVQKRTCQITKDFIYYNIICLKTREFISNSFKYNSVYKTMTNINVYNTKKSRHNNRYQIIG